MRNTPILRFVLGIVPALCCLSAPIAAQGTFTEVQTITCGDTAWTPNLGYPTWNPPRIVQYPKWGFAELVGDFVAPNLLVYTAPPCFAGLDTVIVECAHATQITCDTGIYVYQVACPDTADQVRTVPLPCNDSVYTHDLSGWWGPNIAEGPQNGTASIWYDFVDGAGVRYVPDPGFEGLDWVKVGFIANTDTFLYLFQVSCGLVSTHRPEALPLEVLPNPAKDYILIRNSPANATFQVWNMAGAGFAVHPVRLSEDWQIPVAHWPSGQYLILMEYGNEKHMGTLLVIHNP